jgi:hypothetical protein
MRRPVDPTLGPAAARGAIWTRLRSGAWGADEVVVRALTTAFRGPAGRAGISAALWRGCLHELRDEVTVRGGDHGRDGLVVADDVLVRPDADARGRGRSGDPDPDRLRAGYGEAVWERLRSIRAGWDPDDVFCAGHAI